MGLRTNEYLMAVLTVVVGITAAQFAQTPESADRGTKSSAGAEGGTRADTRQPSSEGKNAALNILNMSVRLGESLTVEEAIRTKTFWFLCPTWALQGAEGVSP